MSGHGTGSRIGDRWRALRAGCVAGAVVLVTMAPGPVSDQEEDLRGALQIAGAYHRALSYLSAKHFTQPETATCEFERLTVEALDAQFGVSGRPCFAR